MAFFLVGSIACAPFAPAAGGGQAAKGAGLPAHLANDPVALALGAEVVNAAIKEGAVNVYGGTTDEAVLKAGAKDAFEKRFGIKIEPLTAQQRALSQRILTEHATGNKVADVYLGNDQYMLQVQQAGALEQWRPPSPELDKFKKEVFVREPAGYWWPVHVSAQALMANTNLVPPSEFPKSYKDVINPKWKGKMAIRDPRAAEGGAWQMLHIYNHRDLGLDWIKKLKQTVDPFIITGGTDLIRDAVVRGQFGLIGGGRGEFLLEAPKGSPIQLIVPEEGLVWTPSSITVIKGSPNPNAAKLYVTWFYELESLQRFADHSGRSVAHPGVKAPIPELDLANYKMMEAIPPNQLADPEFFFKEMEAIFGRG